MAAPAIQHRVVRRDRQAARERLNGFAELAGARLGDAELNDPLYAAGIGGEGALGAGNRARVALRAVFDAGGRAVLDRLPARGHRGGHCGRHQPVDRARLPAHRAWRPGAVGYFRYRPTKSSTFFRSTRNTPPVPAQLPLSPNEVTAPITLLE